MASILIFLAKVVIAIGVAISIFDGQIDFIATQWILIGLSLFSDVILITLTVKFVEFTVYASFFLTIGYFFNFTSVLVASGSTLSHSSNVIYLNFY